jgi:hypothetical protein
MPKTFKIISIVLALAMMSASLSFCQESAAQSPASEPVQVDSVIQAPTPPAAPADTLQPQPPKIAPDSIRTAKKPNKMLGDWKPGKIKLDRNGRIFLGVTAGLLGGVYLVFLVFNKDVK